MRILALDPTPLTEVQHQSAKSGGGTELLPLPITMGRAEGLPDDVDAVIFASDLQGVAPSRRRDGGTALLGIALCEALEELAVQGAVPPLSRSGVVLAGDLYSAPGADQRGANGDVTDVWQTFAERCAWIAGVQGNHDLYNADMARLLDGRRAFLLDGSVVTVGGTPGDPLQGGSGLVGDPVGDPVGIAVGGVGLIGGLWLRPGRRAQAEQVRRIAAVTKQRPGLFVVHEGPPGLDRHQRGQQFVADAVDAGFDGLLVCGHTHWREPLAELARHQVLNVDSRCVVVVRNPARP